MENNKNPKQSCVGCRWNNIQDGPCKECNTLIASTEMFEFWEPKKAGKKEDGNKQTQTMVSKEKLLAFLQKNIDKEASYADNPTISTESKLIAFNKSTSFALILAATNSGELDSEEFCKTCRLWDKYPKMNLGYCTILKMESQDWMSCRDTWIPKQLADNT